MSEKTEPEIVVVAPFLISQCYNRGATTFRGIWVVAPFLISQCYNKKAPSLARVKVVAPFLISQCYNYLNGKSLFYKGFPFYFV